LKSFTIGHLAKRAEVNIETIRYYERRHLVPTPKRLPSGYRQYSDDDILRIRFIRHAQQLGFSLKEVEELLNLRLDPQVTCADIEKKTMIKIQDIDQRIRKLRRIRKVLFQLKKSCKGNVPSSECPILDALDR
jgi:Hg(II)-responsive transcriptional regulator